MKLSIIFTMVLILLTSISLQADIFMKQKHHTDGMKMMGQQQPDQDKIQEIWISKDKISSKSEDQRVVINLKTGKMTVFNDKEKTYFEMGMSFDDTMAESIEREEGPDKAEMEEFMKMAQGMMKFEITVNPTNEYKKINKWNCKKYDQEVKMGMGPITSEVWATEELEMDYSLYAKFSTAMMAMQPGFKDSFEKAMKELRKIKGVPVLTNTVMKMMGMEIRSSQELLEFKKGTAPKGTFDENPANYTKTSMMGGGHQF